MVNRHFSLACHACRRKHTRCDETKPQCKKCTSRGKECPGYRDTNGFLFIDQAEKSAKRARRKGKAATPEKCAGPTVTIGKSVSPDPGMVSVTFFFNSYLMNGRNRLTSRGHFDYLLPLYSTARPDSLLALAMEFAAGRSMASHYCRSVDSIWHAESVVKASSAMRTAISDPIECLTDETLLAVLLLDFAEYIKTRRMRTPLSHVHQNAATGLVRLRGAQNFESDVGRSLLHATRSNSLHRAMRGCFDQNVDLALLAYMTTDSETCNPALQLDGLIACSMRLDRRLARTLNEESDPAIGMVEEQLQQLDERLMAWRDSLPEDWEPQQHTMAQPPPGHGVMGPNRKTTYAFEKFGTLDVALFYNQWRCARLMVTKLLRSCQRRQNRQDALKAQAADLVKDVWKSVPYFIHGPRLSLLTEESSSPLAEAMQQLQLEEPSGLGTWYLGQILDWIIAILADDDGGLDVNGANVAAFCDLQEALHSKFVVKAAVSSRSNSV
ncbi:hypothetical protein M409DRAFT_22099 [Zasmidium cellare ATCC 36951]|uniref:Zn(2)-C6 fungal-type domain-containing protein n=1 Tax=Zasmidium cellare ATCC 36951 TaxID=1080233 RepID=A0A6A6CL66_ZASCE|nr:uncharacterized protein M409DRAFT_22099 [Zasmidium cellare ATCC 36951]KAF2167954.1 hypothetical protein M409DRAFT_22099 [Zasmidium cellare ATCC 36951]